RHAPRLGRVRGLRPAPLRARLARPARRLPGSRRLRPRRRRPAGAAAHPLRMSVVLVGISHRVAPVELRERVALSPEEAESLAAELAGRGAEAVCLSTCNRTELYRLEDEAAATHLFRVAAGLDSMVPGEGEILGQVRAAYERGRPGPLVDRLFRQAI